MCPTQGDKVCLGFGVLGLAEFDTFNTVCFGSFFGNTVLSSLSRDRTRHDICVKKTTILGKLNCDFLRYTYQRVAS